MLTVVKAQTNLNYALEIISMSNTSNLSQLGSVAIIGAGWLGLPLAKSMQRKGVQVSASATTTSGVQKLIEQGLSAFQLALPVVDHHQPLLNCHSLIICIPPRLRQGRTDYPCNIKALVDYAERPDNNISNILLLSSTAVYNGLPGSVDETTPLNKQGDKVAVLDRAEQVVLAAKVSNRAVFRLAGLIGYNRHPGRFFNQGRAIPNPDSVVNLIHQDDVIGLIESYLHQLAEGDENLTGQKIVNCVAPSHPLRGQYYQQAAAAAGQALPPLGEPAATQGKYVDSSELHNVDYVLKYPDLLSWLERS